MSRHLRQPAVDDDFRLSDLIAALSYALDLTEGQRSGHSARGALIGMRLARELRLGPETQSDLFYALLLKDAGCSSNAAALAALFGADDRLIKRHHKLIDWTQPIPSAKFALRHAASHRGPLARARAIASIASRAEAIGAEMIAARCERGADIVRQLGLSEATANAIRHLDEHWDGRGHPQGVAGPGIPLLGRILCLAQTVEVFLTHFDQEAAFAVAVRRRGTWFDPELVDCLLATARDHAFWRRLGAADPIGELAAVEPPDRVLIADQETIERVALAFAGVIDAKTPYTYQHSERVATLALAIGRALDFSGAELADLRRAALLHDIGKLGVSNTILDKAGPLTAAEWAEMRRHPAHTFDILWRVPPFRALAEIAAAHHERLDGSGYHRGQRGDRLGPLARALAVADVAEALSAHRPYRSALSWEETLAALNAQAAAAVLCADSVRALEAWVAVSGAADSPSSGPPHCLPPGRPGNAGLAEARTTSAEQRDRAFSRASAQT